MKKIDINSAQKLIRIEEISLNIDEAEVLLKSKIAAILDIAESEVTDYKIIKKAIDSRRKANILFVYSVDVLVENIEVIKEWNTRHRVRLQEVYKYKLKIVQVSCVSSQNRPVIVGSGPCGLFAALILAEAGLKPLIIERGSNVDERVKKVGNFIKNKILDKNSNIQFGEGGAGTFSDGKLYTLINNPRSQYVFSELVKAGAPAEISYSATPHVGTDKLRNVVKNLRQRIIALGGEVRFDTCLTDLEVDKNNKLTAIIVNSQDKILVNNLIIATGHSARDTYEMLYNRKLQISAKPFAIGVRIEHQAKMINQAQYGSFYNHSKLSAARYKLVEHVPGERSVYTFCMCPGGYVMAATSEEGMVVTNGMSEYSQSAENSNSALLVPVLPSDFGSDHPLAGIEFQRHWEKQAFKLGGSNYQAPAQLVGDFLINKASTKLGLIKPSYLPGLKLTSLDKCLPSFVISSLRKALPIFDKKIKDFADKNAILTGVETRSSAPVRLYRDDNFESNIKGIYPAGEGAGYAGGITSSAIDGMIVAEAIIDKLNKTK